MLQTTLTVLAIFILANPAFSSVNGPTYCHANGRCFALVLQQLATWEHAENYCEANLLNGRLASVLAAFDTSFIISWMTQVQTDPWIGGFRVSTRPFEWADGSSFDYTNWAPGEPAADGKCIQICHTTVGRCQMGQWHAVPCAQQGQILCEYGNWTNDVPTTTPGPVATTTPTPPPLFAEKLCNQVTGKCYSLFLGNLTWFDAETFCENQTNSGTIATLATLASVLDEADSTLIGSLSTFPGVYGNLWLGASAFGEQNWEWTDNGFWSFTNWAPGQPATGQGNCVQVSVCASDDVNCIQGLWSVNKCEQQQAFICENIKDTVHNVPKKTYKVNHSHNQSKEKPVAINARQRMENDRPPANTSV